MRLPAAARTGQIEGSAPASSTCEPYTLRDPLCFPDESWTVSKATTVRGGRFLRAELG